jgi:hypothetical protein
MKYHKRRSRFGQDEFDEIESHPLSPSTIDDWESEDDYGSSVIQKFKENVQKKKSARNAAPPPPPPPPPPSDLPKKQPEEPVVTVVEDSVVPITQQTVFYQSPVQQRKPRKKGKTLLQKIKQISKEISIISKIK